MKYDTYNREQIEQTDQERSAQGLAVALALTAFGLFWLFVGVIGGFFLRDVLIASIQ